MAMYHQPDPDWTVFGDLLEDEEYDPEFFMDEDVERDCD